MIFYPDTQKTTTSNIKDIRVKSIMVDVPTDTLSATVTKAVIRSGATILMVVMRGHTAFNGTSPTVSVGTAAGSTAIMNAVTAPGATAGSIPAQTFTALGNLTADTVITTTVGGTSVTAGRCFIDVYYVD